MINRKAEIKYHRQQIRHHQQKLAELMAPELGRVLIKKKGLVSSDVTRRI